LNYAFEFWIIPRSSEPLRSSRGTYVAGALALERWFHGCAAAEYDGVRVSFVEGVCEGSRVVLERTKGSLVTAAE